MHRPSTRRRIGWLALCALAVWLPAPCLAAEANDAASTAGPPKIYKWVDENGIAHYTTDVERIPAVLRDRMGRDSVLVDEPAADSSTPSPRRAPGERGFEQDARPPLPEIPAEWQEADEDINAAVIADLDARIASLEAEIEADEHILKSLISNPDGEDAPTGEAADTLRELGGRLPQLLAELENLRSERAALSP